MHHCFPQSLLHTACFFLLQILGYIWQIQRKDTIKTGWLTILANLWASLTLSTSIITSSSWVGKAGSFFPIKLSIRWKSSTSYLWLYGHQTHLLAAVTFLSKTQYCTTYSTIQKMICQNGIKMAIRGNKAEMLLYMEWLVTIKRPFLLSDESDGFSRSSCSGCSANPVNIVL